MEAEAIEAAKAAAELNIMGGLASVTGVQSPAPTRTAGATAQNNNAAMGAQMSQPVYGFSSLCGMLVEATRLFGAHEISGVP